MDKNKNDILTKTLCLSLNTCTSNMHILKNKQEIIGYEEIKWDKKVGHDWDHPPGTVKRCDRCHFANTIWPPLPCKKISAQA